MKKRLALVMCLLLITSIFAGCTSTNGIKITQALIKSTDWKSVEVNEDVTVNVDLQNVDFSDYGSENYDMLLDIVNNSYLKGAAKYDIENTKADVKYTYGCNDITATGSIYMDKEKLWTKSPLLSKVVEVNLAEIFPKAQEVFKTGTNERIKNLTLKFMQDYIKEYKHTLKSIKDKGTVTVNTSEGNISLNNIEVTLDREETSKAIRYTLENYAQNDTIKEYLKDALSTYTKSMDQSKLGADPSQMEDELETELNELRKQIRDNPDEIVDGIMSGINLGPKGLVFNFGIDQSGDIRTFDAKLNFALNDLGMEDGKANITINYKATFNNINKTVVNIPSFEGKKVQTLKEFVKGNPDLRDSEIGDLLGVRPKNVYFTICDNPEYYRYYVNSEMKVQPYISGGTLMVPGEYLGTELGFKVDINEKLKTITYTTKDTNTTVKLKVNSKVAYVNGKKAITRITPELKDGQIMVPLRFVCDKVNAKITWNDNYNGTMHWVYVTRIPNN